MNDRQDSTIVLPGASIGILGSGQLGQMMSIAAKYMGYRVHIFSPSPDSPAGQVSDLELHAGFEDLNAVEAFAKRVDVVTVETENIPLPTFDVCAEHVSTFPGRKTLEVCQNRSLEKQFLVEQQIPTCQFKVVKSVEELRAACQNLMPGVLKTTTGGYDGKGQFVIRTPEDVDQAWEALNAPEAILEEWIEYEFEFSIVGVRTRSGLSTAYASIRNEHQNGILDVSTSPSGLSDELNARATDVTFRIMKALDSVGVLTVEFFLRNEEVLVNEIAPRPHNSGHLTIEGHVTSQFEQHVRAVCGMAPGSIKQHGPVAMANLLGQHWDHSNPNWQRTLAEANNKLHLYGKEDPKVNRKMGHLISFADSAEQARRQVLAARDRLNPNASNVTRPAVQASGN